MRLDESIFDEIGDYLKSIGVLKLKWKQRTIGKTGADDLSQMIGPMYSFKDEEMLRIVKILHKRDGNEAFEYAGWSNTEYSTENYTFLDLAVVNNNHKTLDWLLDNVKGLWFADETTIKRQGGKKFRDSGWLKKNGLKLFEYLENNIYNSGKNDSSKNVIWYVLYNTFMTVLGNDGKWTDINKEIEGLLDTKSKPLLKLILSLDSIKQFIKKDDMSVVIWVVDKAGLHWNKDAIIKKAPIGGEIHTFLIEEEAVVEYVQNNIDELNVSMEDWLPEDARDIFLF